MEKSYDFFLSYNKNDAREAGRLATLIKSYDLSVWWQGENSKQEYALAIREAIGRSTAFLVLLSAGSAASEWVGREILEALRLHAHGEIKILPIVVDELDTADETYFHQILGNFNWLFLKNIRGNRELITAITDQVSIRLRSKRENSIYSAADEIEAERLRKQNAVYNRHAAPHIDEIFAACPRPAVLDVGCSDAENILKRLEGRDFSHLVCVDKEADKLEEAKTRAAGDGRVSFLCTDITKRTLRARLREHMDAVGIEGFDFIHMSAVLLHLKNPEQVLRTLRGLLREGGRILIQDEDDGFNVADEGEGGDPSFFRDCFYIWEHSKESGDRFMARRLPGLLSRAGFRAVALKTAVITSLDFGGALREELWDLYFNPYYWVVDSPDYFDKADAYDRCLEYEKKHAEQKARYMRGEIFLTLGVLICTAEK